MGRTPKYRTALSVVSERTERSRSPPVKVDRRETIYDDPREVPSSSPAKHVSVLRGKPDMPPPMAKFENPRCAPVRPGPAWSPQPGDRNTPQRYEQYLDVVREEDNRRRQAEEREREQSQLRMRRQLETNRARNARQRHNAEGDCRCTVM